MIEVKGREDEMDMLIQNKLTELERDTHEPWITQSVGPTGFQFTRVNEEGFADDSLGSIPVSLVWED